MTSQQFIHSGWYLPKLILFCTSLNVNKIYLKVDYRDYSVTRIVKGGIEQEAQNKYETG